MAVFTVTSWDFLAVNSEILFLQEINYSCLIMFTQLYDQKTEVTTTF